MHSFSNPWKHKKTFQFSGKGALGMNGLNKYETIPEK